MYDETRQVLELITRGLEAVGAAAMVLGFVITTFHAIRRYFREGIQPAVKRYRQALGRVVVMGLEVLVAATVIKTITLEPTVEGIAFLAITVAIRTALGWTTTLEMNGRWPWQRPGAAS
jgi:uncharacterized membrane protein